MGQTRNIWVGPHARTQDESTVLTRLFRSASRWRSTPDKTLARRRRDHHPDAPARHPLYANRDLPSPRDQDSEAAPVRRPYLVLVEDAAPTPPWATFSAAMPDPLSDGEIAHLIASTPPRAPLACRADPTGDCEENSTPPAPNHETEAALARALARLRALTIQGRH